MQLCFAHFGGPPFLQGKIFPHPGRRVQTKAASKFAHNGCGFLWWGKTPPTLWKQIPRPRLTLLSWYFADLWCQRRFTGLGSSNWILIFLMWEGEGFWDSDDGAFPSSKAELPSAWNQSYKSSYSVKLSFKVFAHPTRCTLDLFAVILVKTWISEEIYLLQWTFWSKT